MAATATADARPATDAGFEDFYACMRPRLVCALRRLPRRGDPEEIAQDALARMWPRWTRIAAMDDPSGYAFRVAMNLWKDSSPMPESIELEPEVAERTDHVGAADIRASLVPALALLSARQRALVTLVDVYGFAPTEAAMRLGIAPSTARVHLTRARRSLRAELRDAM